MHCSIGNKDAQRQHLLAKWTQELANKQATLVACDSALKRKPSGPERRVLIVNRKNSAVEAEACRDILRWLKDGTLTTAHAIAFVDMLYCEKRGETLACFIDDAKEVAGLDDGTGQDRKAEVI